MQRTDEIKTSLKREYDLYSNAMAFYKNLLKELEQKHHLSTQAFLKRFESGRLGDDSDYFDWYAFTRLLARWRYISLDDFDTLAQARRAGFNP